MLAASSTMPRRIHYIDEAVVLTDTVGLMNKVAYDDCSQ